MTWRITLYRCLHVLFSLKAHACVMSSQALRYSQKAPAGRACSNAWAKRKRKWAKQVWLIGKKKSRLQNSQFFFSQDRFSLTLTRARRASLTRLSLPSLALSFQPRFRFDCSRVLEFAKIRTVLRSRKSQSINTIKYLYLTLLILAESLQQQQVWQKRFVYLGEVIGNLDWIGS